MFARIDPTQILFLAAASIFDRQHCILVLTDYWAQGHKPRGGLAILAAIRLASSLDRRPRSSSKKAERLSYVGCYMPGGLVADCPLGCGFARRAVPKFGFCCLQAATSCGSICDKGLAPCTPCGVPTMIGRMQSTTIPAPLLAPWGTKPACLHAAAICAHGPPLFGVG
jgi:hypothetical protein